MLTRTQTCGQLRESHVGQTASLSGWVNSYRDHGGLIFIDLRDRFGVTQLVFDPEAGVDAAVMEAAGKLRNEDVISVRGSVRVRIGGENAKHATGKIELVVTALEVLNKTDNPPFLPDDLGKLPSEEFRMTYRYVDLRRPRMQQILTMRHKLYQATRRYFDENGFLEIETPILYKSTPEGAREFLVPCRNTPGTWYALPQSPQIFKQILMVSGCDRYMQICRCFRDEDPRADRQAEFTQIDLEMSFVRREHVMEMMEGFVRRLWKEMTGYDVPPMQRMTYRDAMERYGIDRPDTRYALEIADVSEIARGMDFPVFKETVAKGAEGARDSSKRGVVKAIRVPGAKEKLSRKIKDGYAEWATKNFACALYYTNVVAAADGSGLAFETGLAGKFTPEVRDGIIKALGAEAGDVLFFSADLYSNATKTMGEIRQKIARDMGMVPKPGAEGGPWNFLWVIDFPMFERDKESNRWVAMHHPFTSPNDDQLAAFVAADVNDEETIASMVSAGYDIVLNGQEIAGGSIRIHDQSVQSKVFQLLGLTPEQAKEKFSFLLEALRFGAPPHGGVAFGLDRLVMNFVGTDNIRDVIAFPKTQTGADLMTKAPSAATDEQLKDLHVKSTWVKQGE